MQSREYRSERHQALSDNVIQIPNRMREFGIEGPHRHRPKTYRPLLAYVAVSAVAVGFALAWVFR